MPKNPLDLDLQITTYKHRPFSRVCRIKFGIGILVSSIVLLFNFLSGAIVLNYWVAVIYSSCHLWMRYVETQTVE